MLIYINQDNGIRYNAACTNIDYKAGMVILTLENNKIVQVKLGKFLRKVTLLPDKQIKEIVEVEKRVEADISTLTHKLTTNAGEIVDAYYTSLYAKDSYTSSCMTCKHCVKMFATMEGIQLLLLYKGDKLVGRTLVRDTDSYIRIYTDRNEIEFNAVEQYVFNLGFNIKTDFDGLYMDKEYSSYYADSVVCPYLDNDTHYLIEQDDRFLISTDRDGATYTADSTTGSATPACICSCCGSVVLEDEAICVDSGDTVCEECLVDNYRYWDGEYIHVDEVVELSITITYRGEEYTYIPRNEMN